MDMDEKLLNQREVLERTGVSRYTLYRDRMNGKIKAIYFGKNVLFKESDVEVYAKEKFNSKLVGFYRDRKKKGVN